MPKVIVKCRYYSSEKNVHDMGGMLRYIATREGVEKLGNGWKTDPESKSQESLIASFVESIVKSKRLPEYQSYQQSKTKGAASEFISAVLENFPEMLSQKTYLDYIATRPRVERVEGTHGLFTDRDIPIDLSAEAENIRNHNGNVFTVIVSLKREDAERLDYNNATRWRDLVRSKISIIAREYNIPMDSLIWFGAFHNESHHPHIHLMLYSKSQNDLGYIEKKGIDRLRHVFGTAIFKDELKALYDEQTKIRNILNADAADEFEALAEKIRAGPIGNGDFVPKFIALAKHLQNLKGKKVYGYLPRNVKNEVCELVDMLERNEDISRMYEMWYQAKCAIYSTYTDNDPIKKPMSQEEAFKPIRNALIAEANRLGLLLTKSEHDSMPINVRPRTSDTQQAKESASSASQEAVPTPKKEETAPQTLPNTTHLPVVAHNKHVATSIARFANSLSRTFRDRYYDQAMRLTFYVESKLQQEIEAKKKGQNLSM